jgi:hypothetical protein
MCVCVCVYVKKYNAFKPAVRLGSILYYTPCWTRSLKSVYRDGNAL